MDPFISKQQDENLERRIESMLEEVLKDSSSDEDKSIKKSNKYNQNSNKNKFDANEKIKNSLCDNYKNIFLETNKDLNLISYENLGIIDKVDEKQSKVINNLF